MYPCTPRGFFLVIRVIEAPCVYSLHIDICFGFSIVFLVNLGSLGE